MKTAAAFFCAAVRLTAATPYTPDEHTLHLWHLDETEPPFHDSGMAPKPLLGLINGARAGQPSRSGFGRAVSFNHNIGGEPFTTTLKGAALMARPFSIDGPGDNVTAPFPIMGEDGAFTFEALVKLDTLPANAPGPALDIISLDDEGENRVFIFRIDKLGLLNFIPFSGPFVRGGGIATIPVTGLHAINTTDWFHVAVTYDGNEGSPGNLRLYWTRVAPGVGTANLIGGGTLASDLEKALGDFAIGNTGRTIGGNGECNPFPGLIDEVRISDIARSPRDFCFVPEEFRVSSSGNPGQPAAVPPPLTLEVRQLFINGRPHGLPAAGSPLIVPPGVHRLDFDFAANRGPGGTPIDVRCHLEGVDDSWRSAERGMSLVCEILDDAGRIVSRASFAHIGQSPGWALDCYDSLLTPRREPLFLPATARAIRITFSSGTPDTTGQWVIDDLSLSLPGESGITNRFRQTDGFEQGLRIDTIGGLPHGWSRQGMDPAITPLILRPGSRCIGLVDGNEKASGSWTSTRRLPPLPASGATVTLAWQEAYNIIGGASQRATYLNVPPGRYRFRAIAAAHDPRPAGAHLELGIHVRSPLWETPWFRPALAAVAVGLIALAVIRNFRRRAAARLVRLQFQNTLERDRARIARDLHDDLGTRVTGLMLGTSLVGRDIHRDPAAARRHLARLTRSARELVGSMDRLVWAVDPANDTLDSLASHLSTLAQEMFRDTGIPVRIDIPIELPGSQLRSDLRHHFSLAVKEALHNALKHAGPCEVFFSLAVEGTQLIATIRDTGRGFDPVSADGGNGLLNLQSRLAEIGGSSQIHAKPGEGVTVTLRCPLTGSVSATQSP